MLPLIATPYSFQFSEQMGTKTAVALTIAPSDGPNHRIISSQPISRFVILTNLTLHILRIKTYTFPTKIHISILQTTSFCNHIALFNTAFSVKSLHILNTLFQLSTCNLTTASNLRYFPHRFPTTQRNKSPIISPSRLLPIFL